MEKSDWEPIVQGAARDDLNGIMWRVVESQEQVATMALVDNLAEQDVLEQLLEHSKPPYRNDTGQMNYLLATPFRYPPLVWGSRFGGRFEPSLYYGSLKIETALAESAYYRMVFWQGMTFPPPSGGLLTQHTVFSVAFQCKPGMSLQTQPFDAYCNALTDRQNYHSTQALGAVLRDAGVQGFSYISARCPNSGLNAALFAPAALTSRKPDEMQSWLCETGVGGVSFKSTDKTFVFDVGMFLVDDEIPTPA